MLEDALRDAFAAKAGNAPPGSLDDVDDVADAAIRGAGRIRRRRTIATGLAGFVAVAIAMITTLYLVNPLRPPQHRPALDLAAPPQNRETPAVPTTQAQPPAAAREADAIGGTAQAAKKGRLQLPDKGSVAAAYLAKD